MRSTFQKIFAPPFAAGFALLFQLCIVPAHVSADPATQPSADKPSDEYKTIKAWFADLANSDPSIRSEALYKLMGLKSDALPLLKKVVEESQPLLPAQAVVLREIVTQVYLSGDPYDGNPASGFLGIGMEQATVAFRDMPSDANASVAGAGNSGVVIIYRMPGFPGARAFQEGDMILSILDRPDAAIGDLRLFMATVKDMKAGEIVHFLVLRHGQLIRVSVKLEPRPLDFDRGSVDDMKYRRKKRADDYWAAEFASLVKEALS